jgi:hypothetical protein
MFYKLLAESLAVETFVIHQMLATKGLKHQACGGGIMEIARA